MARSGGHAADAAYMREYRRDPEKYAEHRARHRAQSRALHALARLYPEDYNRLLDAERLAEGLPPVHTVPVGRPRKELR